MSFFIFLVIKLPPTTPSPLSTFHSSICSSLTISALHLSSSEKQVHKDIWCAAFACKLDNWIWTQCIMTACRKKGWKEGNLGYEETWKEAGEMEETGKVKMSVLCIWMNQHTSEDDEYKVKDHNMTEKHILCKALTIIRFSGSIILWLHFTFTLQQSVGWEVWGSGSQL